MAPAQEHPQHVIIVGGGLAGALLACALGRAGCRVDVFEHRPDPRAAGFKGGRSINLALSVRGVTALAEVDLAQEVLREAVPMPGRMIHDRHGRLSFQPYSRDPADAINSVSRGGLNISLLEAADRCENVSLHFEHRCVDVDLDEPAVVVRRERDEKERRVAADFIIGADGAFSAVRDAMLRRVFSFDYEQSFLEHGYKELTIPPAAAGEGWAAHGASATEYSDAPADAPDSRAREDDADRTGRRFRMDPHALHIWPRGGSMMIALPNVDGSFTCTLFWPYEGEHGFSAIRSRDDILPFFRKHYPDAARLMPSLVEEFEQNPIGSLVTIRCSPWHYRDRVLILGDAAHAIVPFFGQGMNAAFEDVRVLSEMLRLRPLDRGRVFAEFTEARRPNADAIADMALENFIEMRDRTASPLFRLKKRAEQRLHAWFGSRYTPLYNMISFSNIPYARAQRIALRRRTLLRAGLIAAGAIALIVLTMFLTLTLAQ